jgi:hypothetical protein
MQPPLSTYSIYWSACMYLCMNMDMSNRGTTYKIHITARGLSLNVKHKFVKQSVFK